MDYEKLIEQLHNFEACAYGYHINGKVLGVDCSDFEQVMVDAAEEISKIPTLQAENKKLRADLEQVKRERDELERFLGELEGAVYTGQYFHLRPMVEKWHGQKEG